MKKIALYVMCLVLLTFFIPAIFTIPNNNTVKAKAKEEQETQLDENDIKYNYGKYSQIKVLHTATNTIEEMDFDSYLYGVVSAEMPADFNIEALKAQAVVARTYTIYKILNDGNKHGDASICDSPNCCQAWISKDDRMARWDEDKREENWNKIVKAVNETKGLIITFEGKPINAFFHSNSGGYTETPINVWGGSGYPYLQTVQTSGEDEYTQYASELEISKEEFVNKIREAHQDFAIDFNEENCVSVLENTTGGRVKTIKIGNLNLSGVEVRTIFGLKSANFKIEINDNVKFDVTGYGHGVGMSQTGADSLAKQGYNYIDIIKHFYIGVELENM